MFSLTFAVTLLAVSGTLSRTIPANENDIVKQVKVLQPRLVFLGSVEGKSYFMDKTTPMDWSYASTYCSTANLRLATIKSVTQHNFLVSKSTELGNIYYWTNGRDARSEKQFVWDDNNETLVRYGGPMNLIRPIQTAVQFSISASVGRYGMRAASDPSWYPLCETA